MKLISKSRTVNFNVVMGLIAAIHGSLQLFQPILTVEQFALFSLVIGLAHSLGGVYLRTITTQALKDK